MQPTKILIALSLAGSLGIGGCKVEVDERATGNSGGTTITDSVPPAGSAAANPGPTGVRDGEYAPEIIGPGPDGQILKLSGLRGKYVLVDFWASWCGPCRKQSPGMVKLYNKYKDKLMGGHGFSIYSVSLDRRAEPWKQAIAADGLSWPMHVAALDSWGQNPAEAYGVHLIPTNFLIDPQGKILGSALSEDEIALRLAKLARN